MFKLNALYFNNEAFTFHHSCISIRFSLNISYTELCTFNKNSYTRKCNFVFNLLNSIQRIHHKMCHADVDLRACVYGSHLVLKKKKN